MTAYVYAGGRAAVAVIFAVALVGKFRTRAGLADFRDSLSRLNWLPDSLRTTAVAGVFVTEFAVVALVAHPRTAPIGLATAIAALAVFTVVAAAAMKSGTGLQCRCFGSDAGEMGASHLLRNLGIIVIAGSALAVGVTADTAVALTPAGTVAGLCGAFLGFILTRWDDIAYLVSRG